MLKRRSFLHKFLPLDKKRPVDLGLKNKQIAFYYELPFGILSFSSYVDIETMNIIFF